MVPYLDLEESYSFSQPRNTKNWTPGVCNFSERKR